jgi:hypothetical protein
MNRRPADFNENREDNSRSCSALRMHIDGESLESVQVSRWSQARGDGTKEHHVPREAYCSLYSSLS